MKSIKKITTLIGSVILVGGLAATIPLISTSCGKKDVPVEFSAYATADNSGPGQSTTKIDITLNGVSANDVSDGTWTLKDQMGQEIPCEVAHGHADNIVVLTIKDPTRAYANGTGTITFDKKGYKFYSDSITVFDLKHDDSIYFSLEATVDNIGGWTKDVQVKIHGAPNETPKAAEFVNSIFELKDKNGTDINTTSDNRVDNDTYTFNLHINDNPLQTFEAGTGTLTITNIPGGFVDESISNTIPVENLLPDPNTHFSINSAIASASAPGGYTDTVMVILASDIVDGLLNHTANVVFTLEDGAMTLIPVVGTPQKIADNTIELNISTKGYIGGSGTLTITANGYTQDGGPTVVTDLNPDPS